MSKVKKDIYKSTKIVSESIRIALEDYFENLEGYAPDNLYALVLQEVEKPIFEVTLGHCSGNQSKAAKFLGMSRGTLRKKMKLYEIFS